MRTFIAEMLSNDAILASNGINRDAVYQANTVDTNPTERPFISVSWRNRLQARSIPDRFPSAAYGLQVWVYDEPGDYTKIDTIVRRIRALMGEVVAQPVAGGHISSIRWTGDSPDLYDTVYKAIVRNTSYEVISNV